MEAGMVVERLPAMDQGRHLVDRFVIIRFRGKLSEIQLKILGLFPDIEIVAPVERKMLRPRGKRKPEPIFIERPLFFNYAAIALSPGWERLNNREIGIALLLDGEQPFTVSREKLSGMLAQCKETTWEGAVVEVVSGPMKGQTGVYENGRITIKMFGLDISAKINLFSLARKEIH